MLFVADNPGRCPTVEELVAGDYLSEWNAGDVENDREDGASGWKDLSPLPRSFVPGCRERSATGFGVPRSYGRYLSE